MKKSPQENMKAFIEKYYLLNRVPSGDDTSLFVRDMAEKTGASVLSIPSFQECLTWVMPPKWTVRNAYLETMSGMRIADFSWNPLYLKSYSASFSGVVSREELLTHILSDTERPDSIIYDYRAQYMHGERTEWGFSLPYDKVRTLTDEKYRVHIDVEFGTGTVDILDWILPGKYADTIYFSAHTCHPAQVNDGIGCIAILLELFSWLESLSSRQYTYRMILGPEYFSAAGFLAHGDNVEDIKFGFYLDMLCNGEKIGFSHSYRGDSYIDMVTRNYYSNSIGDYLETGYRGLWGNDEMFFDGPDFEIPTICIARDTFERYHTHHDNLENYDVNQLEESLAVLKGIVDILETDTVPTRLYQGPLYLSKYNLYIDPKKDHKGYQNLLNIQRLMNGERSALEIAEYLEIDFKFVRSFIDSLKDYQLVEV